MADPAFDLYVTLLKRSLTNTLFRAEPDADQANELRFVQEFLSHYIEGPAISMLPLARFDNLQACLEAVVADGIPGDVIETGVWRGGATIFMRGVLKALGDERIVWVADSFEGLPEPDAELYPKEAKSFHGPVMAKGYERFAAGLEQVKANFAAYDLLDERVQFLKGWFKHTLPSAPISRLALMRLDGDYYESTRDALVSLYDKLSPGGFVVVDDYGEESWTYCKLAVDEFRGELAIESPLIRVDSKCYFWRKADSQPMSTPDRHTIRLQLAEILADVLDLDTPHLSDSMSSQDIPGWDSLNHLKIIVAVESRFDIRFSVDEFTAPKNVGEFIDLIRSKL